MKVPGQVSWLSGHHRILSLPLLRRAEQWPATMPGRVRLADHSGGTAADFNGLSFFPVGQTEHRRNSGCQCTDNVLEISTSGATLSMGVNSSGWGNCSGGGGTCPDLIGTPPFGKVNSLLRSL